MGKWYHYLGNAFWGFEFFLSVHEIVMDRLFDGSLVAKMLGFAPYAQSIFVPLAIVGFCFLIYHNWIWLHKRTKRYRFSTLNVYADKMFEVGKKRKKRNPYAERAERDVIKAELSRELEKFGIKSPPINDWRAWDVWFPQMMALAKTRDLKRARKFDIAKFMEENS